ncbi:hypothetical protein ACIRQF_12240 [Streptomyces sp. NPDC101191]
MTHVTRLEIGAPQLSDALADTGIRLRLGLVTAVAPEHRVVVTEW